MIVAVTGKNAPRVDMPAPKQAIRLQQSVTIVSIGKSALADTRHQKPRTL